MHRLMDKAMKSVVLMNNSLNFVRQSQKVLNSLPEKLGNDVGLAGFSSMAMERSGFNTRITEPVKRLRLQVVMESTRLSKVIFSANMMTKGILNVDAGAHIMLRGRNIRESRVGLLTPHPFNKYCGGYSTRPCFVRFLASSSASESSGQTQQQNRKDITTVEDPFDAPTYNIPEKPVTFVEGASYSIVILAGLGVAAGAAYFACKELLFEPKEYKVFGQALERVKNESQVRARIGTPIKGYGVETRNRHARQQIPHRVWTDEDGIEHVEINFVVRGPHGTGNVYTEMFKDKEDKKWKYTYLIVDIKSPSQVQLMLESYIPA